MTGETRGPGTTSGRSCTLGADRTRSCPNRSVKSGPTLYRRTTFLTCFRYPIWVSARGPAFGATPLAVMAGLPANHQSAGRPTAPHFLAVLIHFGRRFTLGSRCGFWRRAMSKRSIDLKRLQEVSARLGDAAIDPAIWPQAMEEICAAVGATGAALLQSDVRTPDIPRTPGVDDYFRQYFADGWHTRDVRAQRGVPLLLKGERVVTDQDILSPEEMRREGLYAESLSPHGLQWFAVIGFWAGPALWGLSIQRTLREGAFDHDHKLILARLSQRLTETATLSRIVGSAVLTGMTNALELVNKPALALDQSGFVIEMNRAAEQVFDHEVSVRSRRLLMRDKRANALLDAFIDRLRATPDTAVLPSAPIVVRRPAKLPLLMHLLPVDGAARTPFVGARVLLVFSDLQATRIPDNALLAQVFGLSRAEARLAALVTAGLSLTEAAAELGIGRETARTQLKAVFLKTGTHRQGELAALLARLH